MAASLSDEELRKKLKLLGEDVGPITDSTRRTYERKLKSLLEEVKKQKKNRSAFSSDDSEVEQNESSKKKRQTRRTSSTFSPPSKIKLPSKKSPAVDDVFKKPYSQSPSYASTSFFSPKSASPAQKNSRYNSSRIGKPTCEVETSDSDLDATESRLSPLEAWRVRNRRSPEDGNRDIYHNVTKRTRRPLLSSTPKNDYIPPNSRNVGQKINNSRQSTGYTRGFTSVFGAKTKEYKPAVNGYVSHLLNGAFQRGKASVKSTNYSHYISWFLVLVAASFFIAIGTFYMFTVQKGQFSENSSHLEALVCKSEPNKDCIPKDYYKYVLEASFELYNLLSSAAGEFECEGDRSTRNVSLSDAKTSLSKWLYHEHNLRRDEINSVIKWTITLCVKNPEWGIQVLSAEGIPFDGESIVNIQEVSALESTHAKKSFLCRLKHSVHWTISVFLFLFAVAAIICLSLIILKFYKKYREVQEKEFYELVEKVLDILQNPDACSSAGSHSESVKAVSHIRDTLIPLKERKQKEALWLRVEKFVEDNESRVHVGCDRIRGEDFKTWHWLPSPLAEVENGKQDKVWQGQAFGSKGKTHIPCSPCLKIRNMFDPEVEYEEDWEIRIEDAILEKCEDVHGILHIFVDSSSTEGCVYMMCDSPETAGKAFEALHCWWFDGNLVTVKYIRLSRYLERYPDAKNCCIPLKPSNTMRRSLSAPYFSSALEKF